MTKQSLIVFWIYHVYLPLFLFLFYFYFFTEFQTLLENCHIKDVCTSTKYLQSNAVCERMHQTVGNVLRTLLHGTIDHHKILPLQKNLLMKHFPLHHIAEVHFTLGNSPDSLVFNRDMFLNTQLIADWHAITQKKEHLIHENPLCENQKRRWCIPQKRVLKKFWKPCKLDERTNGLYRVVETHVNSTVTIELRPGVSERLNIRRNIPYK